MRGHHYILASSALALIVAAPFGSTGKDDKLAAAPMTATSAEQATQTAPAGTRQTSRQRSLTARPPIR